jgi:hypothetical protein
MPFLGILEVISIRWHDILGIRPESNDEIMKRCLLALTMIILSIALSSVSFREPEPSIQSVRKYSPSCGYTIIEFGVGIDCNGDTVKIVRKNGGQALL